MERRCVLCNDPTSDEAINLAIDEELGIPVDDEREDVEWVEWDERWGFVHMACAVAYGSGFSPAQQSEQLAEGLQRLCEDQEAHDAGHCDPETCPICKRQR